LTGAWQRRIQSHHSSNHHAVTPLAGRTGRARHYGRVVAVWLDSVGALACALLLKTSLVLPLALAGPVHLPLALFALRALCPCASRLIPMPRWSPSRGVASLLLIARFLISCVGSSGSSAPRPRGCGRCVARSSGACFSRSLRLSLDLRTVADWGVPVRPCGPRARPLAALSVGGCPSLPGRSYFIVSTVCARKSRYSMSPSPPIALRRSLALPEGPEGERSVSELS